MATATVHQLPTQAPYGEFEGRPVEYVVTKVTGSMGVPGDAVLHMDDRLRMVNEWRVVAVRFLMDKDGRYFREQVIKAVDDPTLNTTQICPWDTSDPTDNGILHSAACPNTIP